MIRAQVKTFVCNFLLLLLVQAAAPCMAPASAQHASSPYIRVPLPRGVSLELPRNWTPISSHSKQTMEAAVTAMVGRENSLDGAELPFAANLYDDNHSTIGIFNIRYYPQFGYRQSDVAAFTERDLSILDSAMRNELQRVFSSNGISVLSWSGTKVIDLSGKKVLVTEYRRSGIGASGPFRVRLVRFINGEKSFTVTVSYAERISLLLKPITDYIISSIRT